MSDAAELDPVAVVEALVRDLVAELAEAREQARETSTGRAAVDRARRVEVLTRAVVAAADGLARLRGRERRPAPQPEDASLAELLADLEALTAAEHRALGGGPDR